MTTHHTQVPLNEAKPGMLLWDAVADSHGHVLLAAGTVLTRPMLASLERHQIEMLAIAGATLSDAEESARSAMQTARIARLFRTPGTTNSHLPSPASDSPTPDARVMLHRYVTNFRSGSAS